MVGGREAGTIGQVVDGKAVAIVRLDRFDGGEVTVGGKPVTVAPAGLGDLQSLGNRRPAD